ncbi:MAG TPA: DUF1579 family protein [Terriglobales bacterium]|nr:DUF1579 family protein [Terriglobales bacterium]
MKPSLFGTIILLALSVPALAFQAGTQASSAPPCSGTEWRQFDFWIGEWNLTWPSPDGKGAENGTNTITRVLGDCVILENFTGGGSNPMRGMSFSTFSPKQQKWQQIWVDDQGSYLDFVGEMKGSKMILSRQTTGKNGEKILQRMVWTNITPNSLDWSWEMSSDRGKNWKVLWPIHYQRK